MNSCGSWGQILEKCRIEWIPAGTDFQKFLPNCEFRHSGTGRGKTYFQLNGKAAVLPILDGEYSGNSSLIKMLVNRTPLAYSLANLPEPGTIHHDPERHLEQDVESQSEDKPAAAFAWLATEVYESCCRVRCAHARSLAARNRMCV
jgi:hypothetical protein